MQQLKENALLEKQDEQSVSRRLELNANQEESTFQIGSFQLNIDEVTVTGLKSMRKMLPREEYKLLKNRKCARMSRTRKREQTNQLISINKKLKEENNQLRKLLGLSPVSYNEEDVQAISEMSDDGDDSGGADYNQDTPSKTEKSDQLRPTSSDASRVLSSNTGLIRDQSLPIFDTSQQVDTVTRKNTETITMSP